MLGLAVRCCERRAASASIRLYSSALGGNRNPMDIGKEANPMLHQEDSTSTKTEEPFELKVPGVVGQGAEPNIPRPGTVDWPNPSEKLMEKVPIAKVTHDGDVTTQSDPNPPGDSMPRS